MSTPVSGTDVNFYPWVALRSSRSMLTSTTTTASSSSSGHSCSSPVPICPAVTKACTATTWFLKDRTAMFASGSTVMWVLLLLLSITQSIYSSIVILSAFLSLYRVRLIILSGFTDMWTIMLKVLSQSLSHKSSRFSSATGQVTTE